MKKSLFLVLVLFLIFSSVITGCQDSHPELLSNSSTSLLEMDDSTGSGDSYYDPNDSTDFIHQTADYLWQKMLSAAGPNGRQEFGCYIYRNIHTGEEKIGTLKDGPVISGGDGTNGSITPGSGAQTKNGFSKSEAADWQPVGFIHTHTTLYYQSSCRRDVGPSEEDVEWAKRQHTIIYTVDFVGHSSPFSDRNYISGGENGDYMVYETDRRE